ncbi:hypothetical protein KESI111651_09480 [Kerstersia similis]
MGVKPFHQAGGATQAALYLQQDAVEFRVLLRQALLAQLLHFIVDGTQFRLDAGALHGRAALRDGEGNALQVVREFVQAVAREQHDVGIAQVAPQQDVVRVRGQHGVQDGDHVAEDVPEHGTFRGVAVFTGQGSQDDVAGVLVLFDHRGLPADQGAVALFQILVDIIEGGARSDVVGCGEEGDRERLPGFPDCQQVADAQAECGVEQASACGIEQGGRYFRRGERRMHGDAHEQQATHADQVAFFAIDRKHREHEALCHDSEPEYRWDGACQTGDGDHECAERAACQHFVAAVAVRSGLVDDGRAQGTEGGSDAGR